MAKLAANLRAAKPVPPAPCTASVYSFPQVLPDEFCWLIRELEKALGLPVWLLIQNEAPQDEYSTITFHVYKGFQTEVMQNPPDKMALLLESPGGEPNAAFRIARLFQRRCKRFSVVVPQYAKSAATLIALGATELILGIDAELGPLDLQVYDHNQERYESALNAVQALERLSAFSMTVVDQTMALLLRRMASKRTDVLLPFVLEYATSLVRPLFEKVDTTDYARKSRDLRMTEEFAARLMRHTYGMARGKSIARKLVENYPHHGFSIDRDEVLANESPEDPENAYGLGLRAIPSAPNVQKLMDSLVPYLDEITAIGRLREVANGKTS